ncbi:ly6/PLAUR domain-containing protein 8 preproprotein [Homo sapiens]|uniref:Ly6/PLAUR domain-containing protein 8 n=1 Tax=Homo sapiens TaxID=9606 RepID=LYPD8_HUMAN|nr:ly6/PLAUR domain-containing protein 8 preproprotein [Homo sapiens]NP_001278212.2 ly6/PLAUR domain-containing protein 8 preproprotein [Homo sapiens]Q6UX82.2 RecName: Full=Ly6/PLAUR domain-containing protein 8; Flags: Precursor [Homo sapiens]
MKGILVAGITAVLVAAVESLSCVQCNSWEKSCVNSIASECPSHANTSCISSSASSSLETPVRLYQNMFCSAENCSEETHITAFTVHVSAEEHFHFVSQCCQGKECSNTSDALDPPLKNVSSNAECPACYESNGTSCHGKPWKCYEEEQCVFLVAELKNDIESKSLVLKGCSNVSNATCQFLSGENKTLGGVIFRKFECANVNSLTPTSAPTTSHNVGSKASLYLLALASLLLRGLLP